MAQIRCAIAALVCAAVSTAAAAQNPPHPEPIFDTPEFMTMMLRPAYMDLQQSVKTPPVDRAAWASMYQKAARLAETANLLFIRQHAGADTPEWAERSAAVRQAAADVAAATLVGLRSVRASDYETVRTKFAQVSGACNACHRKFGGTNAPTIRE